MLWATCCLAFFGFLRVSEFSVPSGTSYNPMCHLSMKDVSVDNRTNPRVAIKQSKTDPFRRGVHIYLGATDSTICPVRAMLAYLVLRGGQAGPLFITKEGRGLTRPAFSSALVFLLSKLKLNHKITRHTAFELELLHLPLRLGYQIVRLRCWDVGRVMPISGT